MMGGGRIVALASALGLVAGLTLWSASAPVAERDIGSYMTGLAGRTESQIHNVRLASRAINNTVIPPRGTFSFVKAVGTWTADLGYVKAPVSYDGELVRSWGGGVCQASTTLYNAALLAGLEIVERHRHHWPARYAPLGRDAAVAYSDIDLKFRNNLPSPVRIVARIEGNSLVCRIRSTCKPECKVTVQTQVRSVSCPTEVVQNRTTSGEGRWRLINQGHPGFHVVTYRMFCGKCAPRTELVSEDRYPTMHRIVRMADAEGS